MKIVINYDLLDKIRESKTGFSFNKIKNKTLFFSAINMAIETPRNITENANLENYILDLVIFLFIHFNVQIAPHCFTTEISKKIAKQYLTILSDQLQDMFVKTDAVLLQDAHRYKTKYELDYENSKLPNILEKKYIMIPVHNDWDCNERSLVQEHIIGSNEYILSYGEPEKKVLKLGQRQYLRK